MARLKDSCGVMVENEGERNYNLKDPRRHVKANGDKREILSSLCHPLSSLTSCQESDMNKCDFRKIALGRQMKN